MLGANPVPIVQRTLLGTPACQHVFKMYSLSNTCSMICLVFSFCLFCFSVKQVSLASLQDVINYFVTQTQGNLKPFVMETCHNALQMAHSSESKTRKSPAEGQRHKEELTGTPLLQLSWKHFPGYYVTISTTALFILNQECDAASPREIYEIWREYHSSYQKKGKYCTSK